MASANLCDGDGGAFETLPTAYAVKTVQLNKEEHDQMERVMERQPKKGSSFVTAILSNETPRECAAWMEVDDGSTKFVDIIEAGNKILVTAVVRRRFFFSSVTETDADAYWREGTFPPKPSEAGGEILQQFRVSRAKGRHATMTRYALTSSDDPVVPAPPAGGFLDALQCGALWGDCTWGGEKGSS
jgi:hypothetical protein